MSCDAKVWSEDPEGWFWNGIHDGACHFSGHREMLLPELLRSIETCMGPAAPMRWLPRTYPNGKVGLIGYTS